MLPPPSLSLPPGCSVSLRLPAGNVTLRRAMVRPACRSVMTAWTLELGLRRTRSVLRASETLTCRREVAVKPSFARLVAVRPEAGRLGAGCEVVAPGATGPVRAGTNAVPRSGAPATTGPLAGGAGAG